MNNSLSLIYYRNSLLRPKAETLLQHPWFSSFDNYKEEAESVPLDILYRLNRFRKHVKSFCVLFCFYFILFH